MSARPTCCRACRVPSAPGSGSPARGSAPPTALPPGSRPTTSTAARLGALEEALAAADLAKDAFAAVNEVLGRFAADAGTATLPELQARIDRCFGQPSLEEIGRALAGERSGWGQDQLEQLRRKSPTSLAVTLRQLQEGAALDFDAAMRLEYRLVHRFMAGHDFREGVRALIIDKDNRPGWRPASWAEVTPAAVAAYFAPLADGELPLGAMS